LDGLLDRQASLVCPWILPRSRVIAAWCCPGLPTRWSALAEPSLLLHQSALHGISALPAKSDYSVALGGTPLASSLEDIHEAGWLR